MLELTQQGESIVLIATGRLTIRPFQSGDWQAVHAYMSDREVTNYLPKGVMDEQAAKDFVNQNMHDRAGKYAVVFHDGTF